MSYIVCQKDLKLSPNSSAPNTYFYYCSDNDDDAANGCFIVRDRTYTDYICNSEKCANLKKDFENLMCCIDDTTTFDYFLDSSGSNLSIDYSGNDTIDMSTIKSWLPNSCDCWNIRITCDNILQEQTDCNKFAFADISYDVCDCEFILKTNFANATDKILADASCSTLCLTNKKFCNCSTEFNVYDTISCCTFDDGMCCFLCCIDNSSDTTYDNCLVSYKQFCCAFCSKYVNFFNDYAVGNLNVFCAISCNLAQIGKYSGARKSYLNCLVMSCDFDEVTTYICNGIFAECYYTSLNYINFDGNTMCNDSNISALTPYDKAECIYCGCYTKVANDNILNCDCCLAPYGGNYGFNGYRIVPVHYVPTMFINSFETYYACKAKEPFLSNFVLRCFRACCDLYCCSIPVLCCATDYKCSASSGSYGSYTVSILPKNTITEENATDVHPLSYIKDVCTLSTYGSISMNDYMENSSFCSNPSASVCRCAYAVFGTNAVDEFEVCATTESYNGCIINFLQGDVIKLSNEGVKRVASWLFSRPNIASWASDRYSSQECYPILFITKHMKTVKVADNLLVGECYNTSQSIYMTDSASRALGVKCFTDSDYSYKVGASYVNVCRRRSFLLSNYAFSNHEFDILEGGNYFVCTCKAGNSVHNSITFCSYDLTNNISNAYYCCKDFFTVVEYNRSCGNVCCACYGSYTLNIFDFSLINYWGM